MTGETVTALLDEGLSLDGSAGRPLPETGPEIGNILPSVTGHTGSQPSLMSDTAASTMTASAVMLQQAKPDPMQAALTSVTARSMVPDSQLNPDARTSGPALVNTEESSLLTPQMNAVPEPELELVLKNQGQVQRDFESLTMYSESVATGKSAENIAMRIADSGSMGLAQSTPHVPPQFSQLMELPQFQNMRPLQPMADPQTFMEGLGQRLMIMSEKGVQSARLKLYPENLGTLDIKIQVEDNIARVWFTAEHGQAREALETALPKLKDLFAQQDMELIRADVGSDQDRQRASDAFSRADDVFSKTADGEPDYRDEPSERPIIMTASEHALDIYV
jgi:flagellar hook-length control protein FliK